MNQRLRKTMDRGLKRIGRSAWLALKAVRQRAGGNEGRAKLTAFVTGHQRSGTNMVMEALERSVETDVYHERDHRAFDQYLMRELPEIHSLVDRSPAPVVVVKALCEAQDTSRLLDDFAPARGIWVVRHYHDVVNSMVVSFPRNLGIQKRIAQDRAAGDWRTRGMSDDTYEIVRGAISDDMTAESAAALQWYYRNLLYFEHGLDADPRVLLVRYEELVTEPARQFQRVSDHLGIENRPRLTSFLHSASLHKKTAPSIAPGILDLCESLWARFEDELERPGMIDERAGPAPAREASP